jgi:sulfur relay (sulfurtransferase) DsrF/TusC family protein
MARNRHIEVNSSASSMLGGLFLFFCRPRLVNRDQMTGKGQAMKTNLLSLITALALSLAAYSTCFASGSVTLQWDPNSDSDLAGYRVYYRMDSAEMPFNGTGAVEGAAPIDVKNRTSATLSGLESGHTYYFAVTAYNTAGLESSYSNVIVETIPLADTTAPSLSSFSLPSTSSSLKVAITSLRASDNIGVTGYLLTEGATTMPQPSASGWSAAPPTSHTFSSPGVKSLYAWARDGAGNVSNAVGRSVTITLPKASASLQAGSLLVSLTSPSVGSVVSGTVRVSAAASGKTKVGKVMFYLDGSLKASDTKAPFSYSWNTKTSPNGSHTLMARAYDTAGNVALSSIPVTVSNDTIAPKAAVTSPVAGSRASGTVMVSAAASDNVKVTRVEFYLNGSLKASDTAAPYGYSWNTSTTANGSHTLLVRAYDAAGNMGTTSVGVIVSNDTTAPAIAITSPSDGSRVGGTVTVSAKASDAVGVSRVLFFLDGVLKAADTTSPYSYSWNSKTSGNGRHTLLVRAYDAAGNSRQATARVNVKN